MKNLHVEMFIVFVICLSVFQDCRTALAQPPLGEPVVIQAAPTNTTSEDLKRLKEQVLSLERDSAKASKDSGNITLTTAIIAGSVTLAATIFGGIITIIVAILTAKREERRARFEANRNLELARQEALFQHGEKFLEFRLKQMGLFYAPMYALLKQSKALYEKMALQLANDDTYRYKLQKKADSDEPCLLVKIDGGGWEEFRLLDQLPAVRTDPRILALVERIIYIGEQMTKIISEHAGLASKDLVETLGKYLAHHAILSMIHEQGEIKSYRPGSHEMGYFPRELPAEIIKGYNEVSAHLNEYENKTKQVLKEFAENNSQ